MNAIFDNLIISAPNQAGCVLALLGNDELVIDDRATCGMSWDPSQEIFVRAVQGVDRVVITTPRGTSEVSGDWGDLHDVLIDGDDLYVVSTRHNAVVRWSLTNNGEQERIELSVAEDSWHINCLGKRCGALCFSAFGDFDEIRGYKQGTHSRGFVRAINEKGGLHRLTGLSQPHSLIEDENGWFVCNSELGEVWWERPEGETERIYIGGYVRGLAIRENVLYVGVSMSRNADTFDSRVRGGKIVAFDISTGSRIGERALPVTEVYDIVALPDRASTLVLLVRLLSGELQRLSRANRVYQDATAILRNENVRLKLALGLPTS
ncbi:DUF4915 domain-containing protein [Acidithiobacillus caldus]|uniref:DUF4915 domain-containing protein n=1 Tax=Acidithiobacillus caldus TaxID=33059 RepID=UPI00098382D2|nr:DUF4915 domain-containing protein [Acidithiobacillus caldus]